MRCELCHNQGILNQPFIKDGHCVDPRAEDFAYFDGKWRWHIHQADNRRTFYRCFAGHHWGILERSSPCPIRECRFPPVPERLMLLP